VKNDYDCPLEPSFCAFSSICRHSHRTTMLALADALFVAAVVCSVATMLAASARDPPSVATEQTTVGLVAALCVFFAASVVVASRTTASDDGERSHTTPTTRPEV
jgi:hypothetical protein